MSLLIRRGAFENWDSLTDSSYHERLGQNMALPYRTARATDNATSVDQHRLLYHMQIVVQPSCSFQLLLDVVGSHGHTDSPMGKEDRNRDHHIGYGCLLFS